MKPYITLSEGKNVVESVVGTTKSAWDSVQNVVKVFDGICWGITHPSEVLRMLQGVSVDLTILIIISLIFLKVLGFDTRKYIGLVLFLFLLLMVI